LTGKKLIHGYLDRLRENLETLDEQIVYARKMSKPKGKGDKSATLQWAKTLRDLVELRNTTLLNIKTHLLGRDETGSPNEPSDIWDGNDEVEFERHLRDQLRPWTLDRLKLECEDCGKVSEEVSTRHFPHEYEADEYFDLCGRCYEKRTTKDTDEPEEGSEASDPVSVLKEFADTQGKRNVSSTMSKAVTDTIRNTIKVIALDERSSAEKVKMLEDFKAKVSRTAGGQGSGEILESGLALLDKEIERLQREAEPRKSQDADGKPAT